MTDTIEKTKSPIFEPLEPMGDDFTDNLLKIGESFPDRVYILRTAGILQNVQVVYSYYIWNNYIGLAIFTTADYAANFVAVQNQKNPGCISGMQAVSVGIDLARDIGLNSPLGINGERVVCLLLCDRPDSPEIMWLDYTKDNLDDGKYNVLGDILND